jgi:hypothetical protein
MGTPMITHPQKASWSSLMHAEGIPDGLHQGRSSGIPGRREHVSCTTSPCGSWSCSWAGTFVRCQIIKRGSNFWSFIACSCWRAASGSGDVLCRRWCEDSGGNFGIDSSVRPLISGCKIPQTGRGASRKEDRTPPTASLVDPASARLASLRSSFT